MKNNRSPHAGNRGLIIALFLTIALSTGRAAALQSPAQPNPTTLGDMKTVPPLLYFYASARLKPSEIKTFSRKVVPQLYADAQRGGLTVVGSLTSISINYPVGNTPFMFQFALPVTAQKAFPTAFKYERALEFHCLTTQFRGSLDNIAQAWAKLDAECQARHLKRTHLDREVFLDWISYGSRRNLTELQAGVR